MPKLKDLRATLRREPEVSNLHPGEVSYIVFGDGKKSHWTCEDGITGCGIVVDAAAIAPASCPPECIDCLVCLGALRGAGIFDFWTSHLNPHLGKMTAAEVGERYKEKFKPKHKPRYKRLRSDEHIGELPMTLDGDMLLPSTGFVLDDGSVATIDGGEVVVHKGRGGTVDESGYSFPDDDPDAGSEIVPDVPIDHGEDP
jgi:hypothetical protein